MSYHIYCAASNTIDELKQKADFICDETDARPILQKAIRFGFFGWTTSCYKGSGWQLGWINSICNRPFNKWTTGCKYM